MADEVFNSRIVSYPIDLVWRAYVEPEHLTNWFGPKGFTSIFHEFNFKEGGDWKFIFHGPDGKNWDNHNIFVEIKKHERIVFDHPLKPHVFRAEITFADLNGKTRVNFRQIHQNPVGDDFRVFLLEANEQNFDRLEAELKRMKFQGMSDRLCP